MFPTFLVSIPRLVIGVSITLLSWGCNRQAKQVDPEKLLDQLTIERIDVGGIPSQNISIDQAKKEITIQVPSTISKVSLPVSYTLGCSDCYLYNSNKGYDWLSLCSEPFDWRIAREGQQQPISYRVLLKPAGPLATTQNTNPIQYQAENFYFTLPILNYYDGVQGGKFTFRNVETGDTTTITNVFCGQDTATRFKIRIGSILPLGNYTIELSKKNGRQFRFPQLLQVKKGTPVLSYIPLVFILNSPLIELGGYNLYREDNIDVVLTSSLGATTQIKPIDYNGGGLSLLPPPDLKPGYYAVQLTQNGKSLALMPYGNLMIVAESTQQPLLYGIFSADTDKAGPITLERGKTYSISLSLYMNGGNATQAFLRLVNTNTVGTETLIPVKIPAGFFMGSTEGTGISVDIPSTVVPGRYKVYPRYQASSEVRDGLVYGWDVEVK